MNYNIGLITRQELFWRKRLGGVTLPTHPYSVARFGLPRNYYAAWRRSSIAKSLSFAFTIWTNFVSFLTHYLRQSLLTPIDPISPPSKTEDSPCLHGDQSVISLQRVSVLFLCLWWRRRELNPSLVCLIPLPSTTAIIFIHYFAVKSTSLSAYFEHL